MSYSNPTRAKFVDCRLDDAARSVHAAQWEVKLMDDASAVDELAAHLDVLADCIADCRDFAQGLQTKEVE